LDEIDLPFSESNGFREFFAKELRRSTNAKIFFGLHFEVVNQICGANRVELANKKARKLAGLTLDLRDDHGCFSFALAASILIFFLVESCFYYFQSYIP